MAALSGKVESEVEVQSPAAKFFNLFVTQLHDVQNITEVVHGTKVHQGDWHGVGSDSVKHWTYTVGKPSPDLIMRLYQNYIFCKKFKT